MDRICATCGKPLVYRPDAWATGGSSWAHADGSNGHWVDPKPQCPDCGSFRYAFKSEAWLDRSDCADCGSEHVRMLGD